MHSAFGCEPANELGQWQIHQAIVPAIGEYGQLGRAARVAQPYRVCPAARRFRRIPLVCINKPQTSGAESRSNTAELEEQS